MGVRRMIVEGLGRVEGFGCVVGFEDRSEGADESLNEEDELEDREEDELEEVADEEEEDSLELDQSDWCASSSSDSSLELALVDGAFPRFSTPAILLTDFLRRLNKERLEGGVSWESGGGGVCLVFFVGGAELEGPASETTSGDDSSDTDGEGVRLRFGAAGEVEAACGGAIAVGVGCESTSLSLTLVRPKHSFISLLASQNKKPSSEVNDVRDHVVLSDQGNPTAVQELPAINLQPKVLRLPPRELHQVPSKLSLEVAD